MPSATGALLRPAVDVDEVDSNLLAPAQRIDHGAQRAGRATLPADHLADVLGMDTHLEHAAATLVEILDRDIVGIGDDATDEVLERLFEVAALLEGPPEALVQPAAVA
mgnify:CR=1 FL=1